MLTPLGIIMEMPRSQGKRNSFLITDRIFFGSNKPDDMMLQPAMAGVLCFYLFPSSLYKC